MERQDLYLNRALGISVSQYTPTPMACLSPLYKTHSDTF